MSEKNISKDDANKESKPYKPTVRELIDNDVNELSKQYPNLPRIMIEHIIKHKKDESFIITINTPWGFIHTKYIDEANRIIGTLQEYSKHADELDHAHEQKNVSIFPLDKSIINNMRD